MAPTLLLSSKDLLQNKFIFHSLSPFNCLLKSYCWSLSLSGFIIKQRISKRNVQEIIKNELKLSFTDTADKYHTHTLRHTGATLMYDENNTDILIIKEILGHKSICST